jgi:hypothetical protein
MKKNIFVLIFIFSILYIFSETIIPMSNNSISAIIDNNPINLKISSDLENTIFLTKYISANLKNNQKNDKIIKELKIGGIIFNDVKYKTGNENRICLGLFKNSFITFDFKNEKLILSEKLILNDPLDYEIKEGFPEIKFRLENFNFTGITKIDLLSPLNILQKSFFHDSSQDSNLFSNFDYYSETENFFIKKESFKYYEDFDFTIGNTFYYDKLCFITKDKNRENTLSAAFFKSSKIKFDFQNKKLEITNEDFFSEKAENLLSNSRFDELNNLISANENEKNGKLYQAILKKRFCFDNEAINILMNEIENELKISGKIDKNYLFRLLDYIEEFPTKEQLEKAVFFLNKDKTLGDSEIAKRINILSKQNIEYGKIKSENGKSAFQVKKELLFPEIKINGKVAKRIVFDTGCPILTISRKSAKRLGVKIILQNALKIQSSFRDGEGVFWDLGIINKLNIGEVELENVICAVSPKPLFQGMIDGALGGGIINRFNYTIDYKNKNISFSKRKYTGGLKNNILISNEKPYLKVKTGNEEKYFIFDTGNNASFISNSFLIQKNDTVSGLRKRQHLSYDVLGFNFYDVFQKDAALIFNNVEIKKKLFDIRINPAFHSPEKILNFGNIGSDLFKGYKISINFDKLDYTIEM